MLKSVPLCSLLWLVVVFIFFRVLRDVEAVRQEALLLREQMLVVKEDIKRVCC